MEYKEIFKLKEMLEQAGIPFEFIDRTEDLSRLPNYKECYQSYQICYPQEKGRVCSVIEGFSSYGNDADLLEIMGLLTDEEAKNDRVMGWLSAEDVFNRIKTHYENKE